MGINNPLLSVIVPVYKVEQYLNQCVESIVNQTYKNLEIILVDDGSPDSCGEMCDEWAKRDSRIKVIHKQNGGLSEARNSGIAIAKGEWIGFVDSDDYLSLTAYEDLYKHVDVDTDVVEGNIFRVTSNGEITLFLENFYISNKQEYSGRQLLLLIVNDIIFSSVCNGIFKKELFDNVMFSANRLAEDYKFMTELVLQIYQKGRKIKTISNIVYFYRDNANGIIGSRGKMVILEQMKHRFEGCQNYFKYNPNDADLLKLNQESWRILLGVNSLFNNSRHILYKDKECEKDWHLYVKNIPWALFLKAKFYNPLRYFQFIYEKYVC